MHGQRFGKLSVLRKSRLSTIKHPKWICLCSCGAHTSVQAAHLRSGNTRSCGCGCGRGHERANRVADHKLEHTTWKSMLSRCSQPGRASWKNYGGRGITVCARWRDSFDSFCADMGPRPSAEHSIDRIDNDGNYEPGNCRWATKAQQAANRRNSKNIAFNGEVMTQAQWARRATRAALTL